MKPHLQTTIWTLLKGGASQREIKRIPVWGVFAEQRDSAPSQVHQTLLAIAGDGQFLQGDRLDAWSIYLASGSLALHALTWAKSTSGILRRIE